MAEVIANKPLDLQGPKNCRELGGYPTKDGGVTKKHVFLRSDSLDELTKSDEEFLIDYGLREDVDLRGKVEALFLADRINRREIKYVNIPLYDGMYGVIVRDEMHKDTRDLVPKTMEELYVFVCEHEQKQIRKVLANLINFDDGCALFHCTAGKDRTGIISMLILEMADVPRDVIVTDYARSAEDRSHQIMMEEKFMEKFGKDLIPEGAFESKPAFMEYLLDHLDKKYGSVRGYLAMIGVSDKEVLDLRKKFVEPKKDAQN